MAGWIAIHRSLQEHWLWKSKEPFDMRSAWIDLLLLATYTDNKEYYKGQLVSRNRGEVNCSMLWLADRWRWDRRKVKRFLSVLESDGMVRVNSTTDGTTITIENYSKWQDVGTTDCTTDGTTNVQRTVQPMYTPKQSITNNNKGKQKRGARFTPPTIEEVSQYITEQNFRVNAERFIDYYEANGWLVGKNKMKDWRATLRNWERREAESRGAQSRTPNSIDDMFNRIINTKE